MNNGLRQIPPPTDQDFLDGDGMVLVSKNHCLLMTSGLRTNRLERYLQLFLAHARDENKANLDSEIEWFSLIPIADRDILQTVRKVGVKRFHLNIGQYAETTRFDRTLAAPRRHLVESPRRIRESALHTIGEAVSVLTGRDETSRARIEEAANLQRKIVYEVDRRKYGLHPRDLAEIAAPFIEEDPDSIDIELANGRRIKQGEMTVRKPVKIAAYGKTVEHEAAWKEMNLYFKELRNQGTLEE